MAEELSEATKQLLEGLAKVFNEEYAKKEAGIVTEEQKKLDRTLEELRRMTKE